MNIEEELLELKKQLTWLLNSHHKLILTVNETNVDLKKMNLLMRGLISEMSESNE